MRSCATTGCLIAATLLAGCGYDDTPNSLKRIDGEYSRQIYAQTLLDAAKASVNAPLQESQVEDIESAYAESQAAYAEILHCQDEGVCRMSSMDSVCADVAALIAARRALAPYSELLSISEMLSENRGPMNADRLRILVAEAERNGGISEFDRQILTLAAAAAAAHGVWSLTPVGEKERLERRKTHAVDEFQQRCIAAAS